MDLYTDGACSGNPGPGGWAFILLADDLKLGASGFNPATTNNRMELHAVLEGLRAVPEGADVTVYSDSTYVVKTASGKRRANLDLWETIDELAAMKNVTFQWVRGHNGDVGNTEVDREAREAIRRGRALRTKEES